jgi:hypothetical protein
VLPEQLTGSPAVAFRAALETNQRRLRLSSLTSAVLLGAVTGSLVVVLLASSRVDWGLRAGSAVAVAIAVTWVLVWRWWHRWTLTRVALVVDRSRALDNLIVTAEEILAGRIRTVHRAIEVEVFRQALERLAACSPALIAPMRCLAAMTAGVLAGFAALLASVSGTMIPSPEAPSQTATAALAAGDLRVIVTLPAYTRREPVVATNPANLNVLEGSRIRLEVTGVDAPPLLVRADTLVPFEAAGALFAHEFSAADSTALVVRQQSGGSTARDRLLYLAVRPDERPVVTIRAPAKDLLFAEPVGSVPIEIAARDDLALQELDLRFTRVSGSGEGLTFKEGTLPVAITRSSAGEWTGRAAIALGALALEEGDTLVYQAAARDQKPGGAESVSESFLVEIGKVAGIASTGFALPDDRERQALSQQMLIVKTERLDGQRSTLAADAFAEQAKLLGIEQRMVRSEFVFMTGGEVEDEVEEATAAHELTEGRQENRGQSELLAAIREMSRAEARLNSADTTGALVFERAALKALQRAFDRRRYLLRTTPERARIDLARRLTGDLAAARSSAHDGREISPDPVLTRARAAMTSLAGRDPSSAVDATFAAQLLAVDTASEALRTAALLLSAAETPDGRSAATVAVADALQAVMRGRLGAASQDRLAANPLRGRLADELARAPR